MHQFIEFLKNHIDSQKNISTNPSIDSTVLLKASRELQPHRYLFGSSEKYYPKIQLTGSFYRKLQ